MNARCGISLGVVNHRDQQPSPRFITLIAGAASIIPEKAEKFLLLLKARLQ
jgi:hypothetical protein